MTDNKELIDILCQELYNYYGSYAVANLALQRLTNKEFRSLILKCKKDLKDKKENGKTCCFN